ncbi:MAG: ComEC/Rec2 family competence protein, partial [Lachnospiraceae bacterium]|nr:ComEC/Rec2 family competence protein [Lachnospiraceae bacterium]
MTKRVLLIGAIPYLIGILTGLWWSLPFRIIIHITAAAGLAEVIYSAGRILPDKMSKTPHFKIIWYVIIIMIYLLMLISGGLRSYLEGVNITEFSSFKESNLFSLQGTVYKKEYRDDSYRYYLKSISQNGHKYHGRLMVTDVMENDAYGGYGIPIGCRLDILGEISDFHIAENDGGFCERDYYYSLGIYAKMKSWEIKVISYPPVEIAERLYRLRASMLKVYEASLPGEEPGILAAMTLGDREGLSPEVKDMFRAAGIAHILAISGLHISIVGAGIYRMLRRYMSFVPSGFMAGTMVIGYGIMTGWGISTARAVIMFLIMLLSDMTGEAYDMLSSLVITSVIILTYNPMYLTNSGFVFSFGAVLSVCIIAKPLTDSYERICRIRWESIYKKVNGRKWSKDWKETLVSGLISAMAIWLSTVPIVAYYYYEIPLYVVGLNLIFIPVLKYVVAGGLIGGVLGSIWAEGPMGIILFYLREAALLPCHFFLYIYEYL